MGLEKKRYVAFMPLASWLVGFDRYRMEYSKAALPKSYPGRFYMLAAEGELSVGIEKARALSNRLGSGPDIAWIESELPTGPGAMEPNRWTGTGVGWGWPGEAAPVARMGLLGADGQMIESRHEEIAALAFARGRASGALDWAACSPRTFSVLPIASACQARCAFCFSKASASEATAQRPLDMELAARWARFARERGATRAVITGGGEPTLAKPAALEELTRMLAREVGPTLLITNGAMWGRLGDSALAERLSSLADAGLSRVALSRHGVGAVAEARILGIDAKAARVAAAVLAHGGLKARSICVLQKGGVDSPESLRAYVESMAAEGVSEICFKELYVSSLSENLWAPSKENLFAASHQVPLSMAVSALTEMGFEISGTLPWGSPLFSGKVKGVFMSVAAYTEPSVGWEASSKIVRSWNMMADGTCLASLEDPASALALPKGASLA